MRAALFRLGSREHVLLLVMHHIVFDDGSVPVFNRELKACYAAYHRDVPHDLPELPIQYPDFAAWQRESAQADELARQLDFWRAQLADVPANLELPLDRPRPAIARFKGAVKSIALSAPLTDRIRALGRAHGTTMFMTLLAAFNVLLYRCTGQRDLAVGSPIANRTRTELEGLIGFFVNTVALRTQLSGDSTFRDILRRVRETAISAYDNQDVPFEQVVAELKPERNLGGTPIVNVMFFVRADLGDALELDGLQVERFPLTSTSSRFDLMMRVTERSGGLVCSLQYDTDLFDAPTVEQFLQHFSNLVEGIAATPDTADLPISRIPMLSERERRALVVEANQTQADYPAEKTLPQLLAEQVARSPDSTAVVCGEATLTYAQLDEAANGLAQELARHGIARGARIGILIDRSPNLVVALIAILKYGCAYVPLDPIYPRKRLEFIANNARLAAIVTRSTLGGQFLSNTSTLQIDIDATALVQQVSSSFEIAAASPDDVAYTIYTSGSTGTPKGVDISHRSLVNLLWAMRDRPGLSADDTLVAVTTICFDMAELEMFLPLIVGAKLVIATDEIVVDGAALLQLLRRSRATVMQATPVTWQLLIDAGWRGGGPRKILCGGEALSRSLAEQLLERGDELWNLYGPTETTIYSSASRVQQGNGAVMIGSPIANTQFYILDADGELAAPGVPGELFIGGDGVAVGYHDRPDLNRERFVSDTFGPDRHGKLYRTGDIVRARGSQFEFIGRSDQQIKLRGFRIELGEIAAALLAQPEVADAVAIVINDSRGASSIRAYVVPQATAHRKPDWPAALRAGIARSLPRYMLPAAIVVLDEFPRTPNGKVDRQSLALIGDSATGIALDVPTAIEARISEVVKELLGSTHISLNDDLFAIGLHSLLAVRLAARLDQIFDIRLRLPVIFENPSVAALARTIQSSAQTAPIADPVEPIVALNTGGREIPLFFLHNDAVHGGAYCRRLAAAIGSAQPLYAVAPHGTLGLPFLTSVESMALDYQRRLKELQPSGPYRIAGFCAGGMIAFEVARRLRASGDAVEHLVIINKEAPPRLKLPGCDALVRRIGLNTGLDAKTRLIWINVILLLPFIAERGFAAFVRFLRTRVRGMPELSKPFYRRSGTPETELFFAQRVAYATYHPKRYDGALTLIWSSNEELVATGDPMRGDATMGWGAICAGFRVTPMNGDQHSPIRERIDELGKIFSDLFRG